MKKITALFVFSLFFTNLSFANAELFYCPEKIKCSKEGDLSSCVSIGGSPEIFLKMEEDGRIAKGEYAFMGAYATYQTSYCPSPVGCHYLMEGKGKTIIIRSSYDKDYMEAMVFVGTKWNVYGYNASCSSSIGRLKCPFAHFGSSASRG